MLQIDVYSSRAVIRSQEPLTVGMVGAKAHFRFSDPWKALTKTVVFRQGDITKDIVGVTSVAVIPWEVLKEPGLPVQIGIYGSKDNGKVVIPTVWVETDPVFEGADPMADTSTNPTLPVYQQLQEQIEAKEKQLQTEIHNKSLLVVTITQTGDTMTAKKSFSEINTAANGVGRLVVCTYAGRVYLLSEKYVQDQIRFSSVWLRGDKYVLGNLTITSAEEVSVSEQELPPGEKLRSIVSTYDAAMAALNGRLDEHAGSIDALNTQTQALTEQLNTTRGALVQNVQKVGQHTYAIEQHETKLAEQADELLAHEQTLSEHEDLLQSHDKSVEENRRKLDAHAQTIRDHGDMLPKLANRLDDMEETLENAGQGGTGGGSGVHIGTEPPVDETVSLWVNPEGDAESEDAAYYDQTVTVEEAVNSQTLHFPCPIADFHELHIHMTGSNAVSQLYMEAGGESTYLIAPQHGATSGTHIHLMATHQRDTMNLDVTTAAYSEHAQPGVPLGIAGIGNEAASLRLYSKDGGNDLLPGMKIRVWGVYKTQGFGTLKVRNPETGEWESLKTIQGERGKDGAGYILTEEDKQEIAEQAAGLVDVPEYELPVANQDTLGGVQPVTKTDEMTNPVGVDELGALWSAGGDGGNKYRLIVELVVDEDNQAKSYLFTQDKDGNPFSLSKIVINYDIKANSNRADGYLTIAEKLIPYVASVETGDYYGVCEAETMGDVLKAQIHMNITGTFFSVGKTINYIPPIDANKTIDTIRLHSSLPYPIGSTFKIYGY